MVEKYRPKSISFRPQDIDLERINIIRKRLIKKSDKMNSGVIRFALKFTEMNFQPIRNVEKG